MATDYIAATPTTGYDRNTVSWRAIVAGFFVSLLTYLILVSLGLGIGGASLAVIVSGGRSASGLGIGSGIWMVVSALISLFTGCYLAARVAGIIPTRAGAVQGLVVCSLFFGFMLTQVGSGIGLLSRGIGGVVGAAGSAAVDLSENPQVQSIAESALGELNLRSDPGTVVKGIATRLVRGDDVSARNYLAYQAGISSADAQARIDGVKDKMTTAVRDIGTAAGRVVSVAGWTLFLALLLGSLVSGWSGGFGARRNLRSGISEHDRRLMNARAA